MASRKTGSRRQATRVEVRLQKKRPAEIADRFVDLSQTTRLVFHAECFDHEVEESAGND